MHCQLRCVRHTDQGDINCSEVRLRWWSERICHSRTVSMKTCKVEGIGLAILWVLPCRAPRSSAPMTPAFATTTSTLLDGEEAAAASNKATWSSHSRTSHLTNFAALWSPCQRSLLDLTTARLKVNTTYGASSASASFPAGSSKSPMVTKALQSVSNSCSATWPSKPLSRTDCKTVVPTRHLRRLSHRPALGRWLLPNY